MQMSLLDAKEYEHGKEVHDSLGMPIEALDYLFKQAVQVGPYTFPVPVDVPCACAFPPSLCLSTVPMSMPFDPFKELCRK